MVFKMTNLKKGLIEAWHEDIQFRAIMLGGIIVIITMLVFIIYKFI